MNHINKTLFIPLYGKSFVSRKGVILKDEKAEFIWDKEGFELKGKSKSRWLAYYMAMRARVFDDWLKKQMGEDPKAVIFHLGCGMDSRADRVGTNRHLWFDVDFPEVIEARKKYYTETAQYRMIEGDLRENGWLEAVPQGGNAIILLEGVSMYLQNEELQRAFTVFEKHFSSVKILMDCYSTFAARMSKYKNPVNDVGVTTVYGLDEPNILEDERIKFIQEHEMTPKALMEQLKGWERLIFKKLYAGKFARSLYRLYEFKIVNAA